MMRPDTLIEIELVKDEAVREVPKVQIRGINGRSDANQHGNLLYGLGLSIYYPEASAYVRKRL